MIVASADGVRDVERGWTMGRLPASLEGALYPHKARRPVRELAKVRVAASAHEATSFAARR